MALTGPYYWNGTNLPMQSGNPVLISQSDFEDCCCCPCDNCTGTQDALTASFAGTCTNPCSLNGAGSYPYISFTPSPVCKWKWTKTGGTLFEWTGELTYTPATGVWSATGLGWNPGEAGSRCEYANNNVTGVSCNKTTGKLEGSFSMPGIDNGYNNCTDCTMNIAL